MLYIMRTVHRSASVGLLAVLALLLPAGFAQAAESPSPYLHQFVRGTIGASLGFLGGATLGGVTSALVHSGRLDDLTEEETRTVVWMILIPGGLGLAAGASWGVIRAGEEFGHPGSSGKAFLGAVLAEMIWFQQTIGRRDVLEARYPLLPGLGIVLSGLLLPVIGAVLGYQL